ncbi:MAG: M3 family metallopeptidase [Pseudohongiellaceae bacterium]
MVRTKLRSRQNCVGLNGYDATLIIPESSGRDKPMALTGKIGLLQVMLVSCLFAACDRAHEPEQVVSGITNHVTEFNVVENTSSNPGMAGDVNPLLTASRLTLEFPRFDQIRTSHFLPALEQGMAEQLAEIESIANQTASPDFTNTIIALELSGQLLDRVVAIFNNLTRAHSDEELRALQQQVTPLLASHDDSIVHNTALFARIRTLYDQRNSLGLEQEAAYLLDKYYSDFVRAGAMLAHEDQQKIRQINAELALLQTRVSQNILLEANRLAIVVQDRDDLAGLTEAEISAAASRAQADRLEHGFVITLQNTTQQPVLASLENRALREYIMKVSLSRGGNGGEYDNRELLSRILKLRAGKAQLLGFGNYADYLLSNQTAGSADNVNRRLGEFLSPVLTNLQDEALQLQQLMTDEGNADRLAAWDWGYYAEKLVRRNSDFAKQDLKSYFEIDNVLINGVFYAATRLYGITFKERFDLPVYQEDVRVFEIFDATGATLALFIGDYIQRPSKRGGAWSSTYAAQNGLSGTQPVVANHLNIPPAPAGEPVLLSLDEVTTMFHEFGHALHNILSDVRYPYFSGSRVPRDFVEFPSQVNEMWTLWPEVLANYAVHYQTGSAIPEELAGRLQQSAGANQAYKTTEYLAAALLDMAMHQLTEHEVPEAGELLDFESRILLQHGVDVTLAPPRYSTTYFNHIMGGYAAGYYSYIWAEMLDADTVEWFKENGGLTRENGSYFRRTLLSRGGSMDAMELYRNFRGREASIEPLLKRRGLTN